MSERRQRVAFVLKLLSSDHIEEYEKRHSPIWPELEELFAEKGVRNYSIYLLEETLQLFGYAEVDDLAQWESIAKTGVCRRWWSYMEDIMKYNQNGTPAGHSEDLERAARSGGIRGGYHALFRGGPFLELADAG